MLKHKYGKFGEVPGTENIDLTQDEKDEQEAYQRTIAEYPSDIVNSDTVKMQENNAAYLSKSFFMDQDGRDLYKAVMGKEWEMPEDDSDGYKNDLYEMTGKIEEMMQDPEKRQSLTADSSMKTAMAVAKDAEGSWQAAEMGRDILDARKEIYGDENKNAGKDLSLSEFARIKVAAANGNPVLGRYAEGEEPKTSVKMLTEKVDEAKACTEEKDQTEPAGKVITEHSYIDGKDHNYGILQSIPAEFADVKEDKKGNIRGRIYDNPDHTGDYVEPKEIRKNKDGSYDIKVELDKDNKIQYENDDKPKKEKLTLAEFGHEMNRNFTEKVKSAGRGMKTKMSETAFKLDSNFKSHIEDGWSKFRGDHPIISTPIMGTYYLGKGIGKAAGALGRGIRSLMQTKEVSSFNQKAGEKIKSGMDTVKNKTGETVFGKKGWKDVQDHQEFLGDMRHPKDPKAWEKQVDQMMSDARSVSDEMKKNPMYSADKSKWQNAQALRNGLRAASQREDMPDEYKKKFVELASDKNCDQMFTRSVGMAAYKFTAEDRAVARAERTQAMEDSIARKREYNNSLDKASGCGSVSMDDFKKTHTMSHEDRVRAAEAVSGTASSEKENSAELGR